MHIELRKLKNDLGRFELEGQSKLMVFMNAFDSMTPLTKKMKLLFGLPTNFDCNLEFRNRPGTCTSEDDNAGILLSIDGIRSSDDNLSSTLQSDSFRIRPANVHLDNA